MTPDQEKQLKAAYEFMTSMQASARIPFNTQKAIEDRIELQQYAKLETSAKVATSENKSVNEAGSSSYSVLGPPDGWEQRTVGGAARYYPFWL